MKKEMNSEKISLTPLMLIIFGGVFLAVSYSPNHHWDEYYYLYSTKTFPLADLRQMEPELGRVLFPPAFFSAKIGFVTYLSSLLKIFSGGVNSLYFLQFIFALQVIFLSGAVYLLLKELFKAKDALYMSVIFLFLPLSTYFSYKILSEYFSLFWIILGCWLYLLSLAAEAKRRFFVLVVLAVMFLFLGVLCRFTSFLFFCGMIAALFLVGDRRYSRSRLLITGSVTVIAVCALSLIFYNYAIGLSPQEIGDLIRSLTQRKHGLAIRVYSVFMFIQFFWIALLACMRKILSPEFWISLLWFLICSLPFLFLSQYVEPRFFYMATVPLAVLTFIGLRQIKNWLSRHVHIHEGRLILFLLFLTALGNRFIFSDLMPYEINQKQYIRLIQALDEKGKGSTIVIPWTSDYCFLKYIYPEKNIHLARSEAPGRTDSFFHLPSFVKWAGGNQYLGKWKNLALLSPPVYYTGWKFNPAVIKIKRKMLWLKNRYVNNIEVQEGLKNHLTQSWIWYSPHIELRPVLKMEPYEAFSLSIK